MDELFIFSAIQAYLERYLGRPGLIEGGRGRIVTVAKAGFRSLDLPDIGQKDVICAFFKVFPLGREVSWDIDILPGRFVHDGRAVPVSYRSLSGRPLKFSGEDVKKTLPDTTYRFLLRKGVN